MALDLRAYDETVILKDGGSIRIRAIRPEDKALLAEHFRGLSLESIRHRMFGVKKELSARELSYFTELDFIDHVGLAAISTVDGAPKMIGVARYCRFRSHDGNAAAEVAFAVVDARQNRGIGSILLERLKRISREQGVDRLWANVMSDNVHMMHALEKAGFRIEGSIDSGVYRLSFGISNAAPLV